MILPAHWSFESEFGDDGLVRTDLATVFTSTLLNEEDMVRFVQEVITSLPSAPDTYDTIRLVENIPDKNPDTLGIPDGVFMRPRVIVISAGVESRMSPLSSYASTTNTCSPLDASGSRTIAAPAATSTRPEDHDRSRAMNWTPRPA